MDQWLMFIVKGFLLTWTFTCAAQRWELFKAPRERLITYSPFLRSLLDCFECTSVWAALFTICYLKFFEFELVSWALIFHRLACFGQILYDFFDARRAVEEGKIGG